MHRWLLLLIPLLFILSCRENAPTSVSPHLSEQPTAPPKINRDSLVRNNSFQTAFQNGTIRSTRALITWKQCTDPDFLCYRISRNNTTVSTIDSADGTSFADSTLQQNSWYQYTIAALLRNGRSRIDTVTIRTPKFLPPVPNKPRVDTTGTIYLSWYNQTETTEKYVIERKPEGVPDFAYQKVGEREAANENFTDYPPVDALSYVYRLSAWNRFEHTAYSLTSPVYYSMAAPTLRSVYQIGTTRAVGLSFDDHSSAETKFNIYRRPPGGAYVLIGSAPANAAEFIDADAATLSMGSIFYYKVECYNRVQSGVSSEMSVQLMRSGVELSPSVLMQFPVTNIGSVDSLTLTIRNTGTSPLDISNAVSSNPCFVPRRTSFSVPGGSSSTVAVVFTPTDTLSQSGILTLSTTLGKLTIPLRGQGHLFTYDLYETFEGGVLPWGWTTSSTNGWYVTSEDPFNGAYAARSGRIPNNDSTKLMKSVVAYGNKCISFRYRVSSEYGQDSLKFYIDGRQRGGWSGDTDWQSFSVNLTVSGMVTLTWIYVKDRSATIGADAAWIDNVLVQ